MAVGFDASASSDSDGTITGYAWDFGDGNTGSGVTANHTYTTPGLYTAQLITTDNDNGADTATTSITVTTIGGKPVAVINASPASGKATLLVSFDGTASYDIGGSIVSYEWDFGDGSTSTASTIAHPYTSQGSFLATLIVTDDSGNKDTTSTFITVNPPNVDPIAAFTATPDSGDAPLAVSFDASASSDSDGSIVSWEWNYGNNQTGEGETANTTYYTAGTYTVELVVFDNDGARDTLEKTIKVSAPNVAPTAIISAIPTTGTEPLFVSFDGTGSTDSDGTIASYAWDFGDGNNGTGATVTHTYANAGTFTAILTVTDDDGATGTSQVLITVNSAYVPPVTLDAIEATYTNSNNPTSNYGSKVDMKLRNKSRIFEGFIKFDISSITNVTSAKLQVFSNNVVDLDIFVFGTSDAWDENTLTYNSRPAKTTGELGSVLVEIAPQYYEVDVTSYVQGELGGDGLISFYVDGGVVSPICYIQSDDGDNPPSWYWKQGTHPTFPPQQSFLQYQQVGMSL